MPDYSFIAQGYKQPDSMQQLSGLLGVARGAQDLQRGAQDIQRGGQALESDGITLNERKALQGVLSDPRNFTDDNGAFSLDKAQSAIMRAAPTTGAKYMSEIATAHNNALTATRALNSLTAENRSQIGSTLASLPDDAPQELVFKTVDALDQQYGGRLAPLVKTFKQGYEHAAKVGGQQGAVNYLRSATRGVLPQETQQAMNTPAGVAVSDNTSTKLVNVKPGANVPQGAVVPGTEATLKVGPGGLEGVQSDSQGNQFVVSKSPQGKVLGTRPLQSTSPAAPGPFTLPPGETPDSLKMMQGERQAAQAAANKAPVMHDINRTIIAEARKGLNTGALGQLTQRISSATGYNIGEGTATDYNLLGKMLERSALEAAQAMGPHTNAGLDAAIRANGSLEYTPTAIKKIAYLNDAIVSGMEMYRDGLEGAIAGSGNNVFTKRDFDQKWAKVATPQVLRFKNAVDTGNKEEVDSVLKEVGGKGSGGAKKLHGQLTELLKLSGR